MNILVTGGAGFIGRWIVKSLLEQGNMVTVFDNLSNSRLENIKEFEDNKNFEFIKGDIRDKNALEMLFQKTFDIVYHLAASIIVQESIDNPEETFYNDTVGTVNILERAKIQMFGKKAKMDGEHWIFDESETRNPCKVVFMSTCMVYDRAANSGITESHPTKPISPYGASKIAAENLVLSYNYTYGLPTVVIRPFNTYGPYQKSNGEGGVVAIFAKRHIQGELLNIYGDGTQTRDLLYVEDCARFVIQAGMNNLVDGMILNAGLGKDVSINELAYLICKDKDKIKHVAHIHPQSEIPKLLCDYSLANKLLGWSPQFSLEEGIQRTTNWIKDNM